MLVNQNATKKILYRFGLLILLAVSCNHEFNNIVDPKADSYIGTPQFIGINKTVPIFPVNTEVLYPSFKFVSVKNSTYYGFELYDKNAIASGVPLFHLYSLERPTVGTPFFSEEKSWPLGNEQEALWNLPLGDYYYRVCVNSLGTKNQFGAWSNLYSFSQKVRLKEMYWDYNNGTYFTTKQGYRYYFSANGDYEKKLEFLQTGENPPPTYYECIVTNYDKNGNPLKEMGYTNTDATPDSLLSVKCYQYSYDNLHRLSVRKKLIMMEESQLLYEPIVDEEDHYFYEDEKSDNVAKIERYKIDRKDGRPFLFFVSNFKNGKQDQTNFYYEPSEGQPLKIKYYYKMYYHDIHQTKQIRAEYFLHDAVNDNFYFYNNYIMRYNFTDEDNANEINLRGSLNLNNGADKKENRFKEIHPPLF